MPVTRRSTSGARSSQGKQSTLSFHNRVTKPVTKSKTLGSPPSKQSPLKHVISATEDEPGVKDDAPALEPEVVGDKAQSAEPEPVASEARAAKISDRQIDQYWRKLEAERLAKRLHQEDLSVAEKVLRYFDVSSQYGPCVGISRVNRWRRAKKLGLDPPPEVLAVLMKEEQKGAQGLVKAHMDEILNSTAVGTS